MAVIPSQLHVIASNTLTTYRFEVVYLALKMTDISMSDGPPY